MKYQQPIASSPEPRQGYFFCPAQARSFHGILPGATSPRLATGRP